MNMFEELEFTVRYINEKSSGVRKPYNDKAKENRYIKYWESIKAENEMKRRQMDKGTKDNFFKKVMNKLRRKP